MCFTPLINISDMSFGNTLTLIRVHKLFLPKKKYLIDIHILLNLKKLFHELNNSVEKSFLFIIS